MEKIIATFSNPTQAERALLEIKNSNQGFDGVTLITNPHKSTSKISETRSDEPMANFSNVANQVIDTAATAGRLVGSISGIAAVGLFSIPMMVMTPFMQGQNNSTSNDYSMNRQNASEKQTVTIMGDSDLTTAKNILISNGAEIICSNEHV